MQFHFVVNPAGASGYTGERWKEIEEILKERGISYRVHFSTKSKGIIAICEELTRDTSREEDGVCRIVVVGGDGSLNEAVNGIRDFANTRVALIPAGSGNDLAADQELADDEILLSRILLGEETRTMDLGETICENPTELKGKPVYETDEEGNVHYLFHTSSGIGFDADVCEKVAYSRLKKVLNAIHLGKTIYILTALRQIFATHRFSMDLSLDYGRSISEERVLLMSVMNHRYEGGGLMLCPDADDQDGQLDLCWASLRFKSAFFWIFPSAYSGKHVKYKAVHIDRTTKLRIETQKPHWVHTDGEVGCKASTVRIRVFPEKLHLMM